MAKIIKKSLDHLDETKWSYRKHLLHSIKQSNKLILTALKSYIHGFIPALYKSDGPITIIKMYREIIKIHHIQKINKQLKDNGDI